MPETGASALARVGRVLDHLLDPDSGCPWDLKQTPDTLKLYLLEETYELLDALEKGAAQEIIDELGDCFFILCFLVRLFEKKGLFGLDQVLEAAAAKIMARHPHVFGQGRALEDADEVRDQWHEIKKKEKQGSILEGIPRNLPALLQAHRLTERAGRVGFDWEGPAGVLETLDEEIIELKAAVRSKDQDRIKAELGDVLFTLANMARHLALNAEETLRATNARFFKRFEYIADQLARRGRTVEEAALAEMDELWEEAKLKGL